MSGGAGSSVEELQAQIAELERELASLRSRRRRTRTGRPPGRPRRLTPELLAEIERLRGLPEPLPWAAIARRLGVPRGSASKWWHLARKARVPPEARSSDENGPETPVDKPRGGFGESGVTPQRLPNGGGDAGR